MDDGRIERIGRGWREPVESFWEKLSDLPGALPDLN